jgi:hypothetical protein
MIMSTLRLYDMKARACSGLTLRGAFFPSLKVGAWGCRMGQISKNFLTFNLTDVEVSEYKRRQMKIT